MHRLVCDTCFIMHACAIRSQSRTSEVFYGTCTCDTLLKATSQLLLCNPASGVKPALFLLILQTVLYILRETWPIEAVLGLDSSANVAREHIVYCFKRKELSVKSILMSTPTPLKPNCYLMPSGGPDSTRLHQNYQMQGNKNSSFSCRVVTFATLLQHSSKKPPSLYPPHYLIHF